MTLLIYDIASNKRRRKVVKILESYGNRVQESAFEMEITPVQIRELTKKIKKVINKNEDNIRVYRLGRTPKIEAIGIDKSIKIEPHIII